jgi:hypothetical protein
LFPDPNEATPQPASGGLGQVAPNGLPGRGAAVGMGRGAAVGTGRGTPMAPRPTPSAASVVRSTADVSRETSSDDSDAPPEHKRTKPGPGNSFTGKQPRLLYLAGASLPGGKVPRPYHTVKPMHQSRMQTDDCSSSESTGDGGDSALSSDTEDDSGGDKPKIVLEFLFLTLS